MSNYRQEAQRILAGKLSVSDLRTLERSGLISPSTVADVRREKHDNGRGYTLGSVTNFHPCDLNEHQAKLLYYGLGLAFRFAIRMTTLVYYSFAIGAKEALTAKDVVLHTSVSAKFRTAIKKLHAENARQAYGRSLPRFLSAELGISITEASKAVARAVQQIPTYTTLVAQSTRKNPLHTSAESTAFWTALAAALQSIKFGVAWKGKRKAINSVISKWSLSAMNVHPTGAKMFLRALEHGAPQELNATGDANALLETGAFQDDNESNDEEGAVEEMGAEEVGAIEAGQMEMNEAYDEAGGLFDLIKGAGSALFSGAKSLFGTVAPMAVQAFTSPTPGASPEDMPGPSPAAQVMQRMVSPSAPSAQYDEGDEGGEDEGGEEGAPPKRPAAPGCRGAAPSPFFLETAPKAVVKRKVVRRPAPVRPPQR